MVRPLNVTGVQGSCYGAAPAGNDQNASITVFAVRARKDPLLIATPERRTSELAPSPTSASSISVIVPVGRVDDALETQLAALRAQQHVTDAEIIIAVNDASRAGWAHATLAATRTDDPRVRVVDASERQGAAHARNTGAATASGDILAFCDADDLVTPGWLAALVAGLDHHDAVGGRLDEMDGVTSHHRPPPTPGALPTFLGSPYIVSANLAVRRAAFDAVGGFDVALHRCEDIAFSWRLLVAGYSLGYVDEACIAYRPRIGPVALVRQHFAYGWGMAQVLHRYGLPEDDHWRPVRGAGLLQPNGQGGGSGGLFAVARRASLAGGRALGALAESVAHGHAHNDARDHVA